MFRRSYRRHHDLTIPSKRSRPLNSRTPFHRRCVHNDAVHPPSPRDEPPSSPVTSTISGPSQNFDLTSSAYFYSPATHPPPTARDLRAASAFFTRPSHSPRLLFSTPRFRKFPWDARAPEIAFFGRSNCGKSSLVNAVFAGAPAQAGRGGGGGDKAKEGLAHVGARPGFTRTMNAYGVGPTSVRLASEAGGKGKRSIALMKWVAEDGIVLVDMPGYGFGSEAEWGEEIVKYVSRRRQLRRAFLLVDSTILLQPHDRALLRLLNRHAVPHQIVLTKVDKLLPDNFSSASTASSSPSSSSSSTTTSTSPELAKAAALAAACARIRAEVDPAVGDGGGISYAGAAVLTSVCSDGRPGKRPSALHALGHDCVRWAILEGAGKVRRGG